MPTSIAKCTFQVDAYDVVHVGGLARRIIVENSHKVIAYRCFRVDALQQSAHIPRATAELFYCDTVSVDRTPTVDVVDAMQGRVRRGRVVSLQTTPLPSMVYSLNGRPIPMQSNYSHSAAASSTVIQLDPVPVTVSWDNQFQDLTVDTTAEVKVWDSADVHVRGVPRLEAHDCRTVLIDNISECSIRGCDRFSALFPDLVTIRSPFADASWAV